MIVVLIMSVDMNYELICTDFCEIAFKASNNNSSVITLRNMQYSSTKPFGIIIIIYRSIEDAYSYDQMA